MTLLSRSLKPLSPMITDPLFYRLFNSSPETFFMLLGMPSDSACAMAEQYDFQAIELKQSAVRTDGVFCPRSPDLPLYFVEVQFYPLEAIFAGILVKAFTYLLLNKPGQDFYAVVLFASRSLRPKSLKPYQALLQSRQLQEYFLDEMEELVNAPVGFAILYLIRQDESLAAVQARDLITRVRAEIGDEGLREELVQLIATVILYKLPRLTRDEVEAMLQIHDIRESRVYQEAVADGRAEVIVAAIPQLVARNFSADEIAKILSMDAEEVRRLMAKTAKS